MDFDGLSSAAVAQRWIERALVSCPAFAFASPLGEDDPFRNPAVHTLRQSLNALAHELLGAMDEAAVVAALDALVRLRAVQDCSPAEAVGFVFELRAAVRDLSGTIPEPLQVRIDRLARLSFNQYMACREHVFALRVRELRLRAQCAVE